MECAAVDRSCRKRRIALPGYRANDVNGHGALMGLNHACRYDPNPGLRVFFVGCGFAALRRFGSLEPQVAAWASSPSRAGENMDRD
jgi:hypothetical protein